MKIEKFEVGFDPSNIMSFPSLIILCMAIGAVESGAPAWIVLIALFAAFLDFRIKITGGKSAKDVQKEKPE